MSVRTIALGSASAAYIMLLSPLMASCFVPVLYWCLLDPCSRCWRGDSGQLTARKFWNVWGP